MINRVHKYFKNQYYLIQLDGDTWKCVDWYSTYLGDAIQQAQYLSKFSRKMIAIRSTKHRDIICEFSNGKLLKKS